MQEKYGINDRKQALRTATHFTRRGLPQKLLGTECFE